MKYMGSKRAMLRNGLGEALEAAAADADRVVDLFTGSASVAWHAAEKLEKPVFAGDLQLFATSLAAAIVTRTRVSKVERWWPAWKRAAMDLLDSNLAWNEASKLQARLPTLTAEEAAAEARSLISSEAGVVAHAYGGYYFSPWQALWLDALRQSLPRNPEHRTIALAAVIQAASRCAAAPGHTAQPFKANASAGPYLLEAWQRDLPAIVQDSVRGFGIRHAIRKGSVQCGDAGSVVRKIRANDLVFIDPPYSGVHYSRFYHVLETVARGSVGAISGAGRYPPSEERPASDYSVKTKSEGALTDLLREISSKGASAIVTFPAGTASNGLSGDRVRDVAAKFFTIKQEKVSARFSTMGGNSKHRAARQDTYELILTLTPP
jgi:adenine-specific DNA-methyltransferase